MRLGRDWIAATFGAQSRTAWHADSFGHSAAEPIWLNQLGLHYVFAGPWPWAGRAAPPPWSVPVVRFYWSSPADPTQRVLAVYLFYSDPWGPVYQLTNLDEQVAALRTIVDREFGLTSSKYLFLPFGGISPARCRSRPISSTVGTPPIPRRRW